MMRIVMLLIISSAAIAQSPDVLDPGKLLTPETWALIFSVLSSPLTMALTDLFKRWFLTSGWATRGANYIINALTIAGMGLVTGTIPLTGRHVLLILASALLGALIDFFKYLQEEKLVQRSVDRAMGRR